jgi:hypothetical protein
MARGLGKKCPRAGVRVKHPGGDTGVVVKVDLPRGGKATCTGPGKKDLVYVQWDAGMVMGVPKTSLRKTHEKGGLGSLGGLGDVWRVGQPGRENPPMQQGRVVEVKPGDYIVNDEPLEPTRLPQYKSPGQLVDKLQNEWAEEQMRAVIRRQQGVNDGKMFGLGQEPDKLFALKERLYPYVILEVQCRRGQAPEQWVRRKGTQHEVMIPVDPLKEFADRAEYEQVRAAFYKAFEPFKPSLQVSDMAIAGWSGQGQLPVRAYAVAFNYGRQIRRQCLVAVPKFAVEESLRERWSTREEVTHFDTVAALPGALEQHNAFFLRSSGHPGNVLMMSPAEVEANATTPEKRKAWERLQVKLDDWQGRGLADASWSPRAQTDAVHNGRLVHVVRVEGGRATIMPAGFRRGLPMDVAVAELQSPVTTQFRGLSDTLVLENASSVSAETGRSLRTQMAAGEDAAVVDAAGQQGRLTIEPGREFSIFQQKKLPVLYITLPGRTTWTSVSAEAAFPKLLALAAGKWADPVPYSDFVKLSPADQQRLSVWLDEKLGSGQLPTPLKGLAEPSRHREAVSLKRIVANRSSVEKALWNVSSPGGKLRSRSTGQPLQVWKLDGEYFLTDGHHRLVEHLLTGAFNQRLTVEVEVIGEGFSEFYAIPQGAARWSPDTTKLYGGLERFADESLLKRDRAAVLRSTPLKGLAEVTNRGPYINFTAKHEGKDVNVTAWDYAAYTQRTVQFHWPGVRGYMDLNALYLELSKGNAVNDIIVDQGWARGARKASLVIDEATRQALLVKFDEWSSGNSGGGEFITPRSLSGLEAEDLDEVHDAPRGRLGPMSGLGSEVTYPTQAERVSFSGLPVRYAKKKRSRRR